jgi:hypothetical protein
MCLPYGQIIVDVGQVDFSKEWDWNSMSQNSGVTIDDIMAKPGLPWDWNSMSWHNPNITISDVVAHLELPWSWNGLSDNQRITIRDIISYPGLPWNWTIVSTRKYVYCDIVNNIDLPWKWKQLSICGCFNISHCIGLTIDGTVLWQ